MKRFYHMIVARESYERFGDKSTRREYISTRQGSAPDGWVCVGVCGYHDVGKLDKRFKRGVVCK